MNEKEFTFRNKTSEITDNVKTAAATAKDTFVTVQKGTAVLTAIKMAVKNAPGVPDQVKAVMDTPFGDAAAGLLLHITAPSFTRNRHITKAVEDANVVGIMTLTQQYTWISDMIEGAVTKVVGADYMEETNGKDN